MNEQINPPYIAEHRCVLEAALSLPLPDAVFTILHYNRFSRRMGPGPHCEEIPLGALRTLGLLSELDLWCARTNALHHDAYAAGDAWLAKRETHDAAMEGLRVNHPGFSEETYEATMSYGCFLAR